MVPLPGRRPFRTACFTCLAHFRYPKRLQIMTDQTSASAPPPPSPSPAYIDRSIPAQEAMLTREFRHVASNRERRGRENKPLTGIALSGGGIRSAIFCLGALQALAARNVLPNFDYMSSVSGGGYIHAALQWFWYTDPQTDSANNFPFGTASQQRSDELENPNLKFLRAHGRYLTPGDGLSIW